MGVIYAAADIKHQHTNKALEQSVQDVAGINLSTNKLFYPKDLLHFAAYYMNKG